MGHRLAEGAAAPRASHSARACHSPGAGTLHLDLARLHGDRRDRSDGDGSARSETPGSGASAEIDAAPQLDVGVLGDVRGRRPRRRRVAVRRHLMVERKQAEATRRVLPSSGVTSDIVWTAANAASRRGIAPKASTASLARRWLGGPLGRTAEATVTRTGPRPKVPSIPTIACDRSTRPSARPRRIRPSPAAAVIPAALFDGHRDPSADALEGVRHECGDRGRRWCRRTDDPAGGPSASTARPG